MQINFVELCTSTQEILVQSLKNSSVSAPYMLVAKNQTNGKGSRGNEWQSRQGNLHLSFALCQNNLPDDLPTNSASIYFAYLFCSMLREYGSKIWLKWPNDLYLNKKVGGVITTKTKDFFVCGIGVNLTYAPQNAQILDIKTSAQELAKNFAKYLENLPKWKNIFSKYLLEFQASKKFSVHIDDELVRLDTAQLQFDGSIIINDKRVYLTR